MKAHYINPNRQNKYIEWDLLIDGEGEFENLRISKKFPNHVPDSEIIDEVQRTIFNFYNIKVVVDKRNVIIDKPEHWVK